MRGGGGGGLSVKRDGYKSILCIGLLLALTPLHTITNCMLAVIFTLSPVEHSFEHPNVTMSVRREDGCKKSILCIG